MTRLADIRTTPLSVEEVVSAVSHPGAGGVALFIGIVRDHNEGRPTARLEYEAYLAIALKTLRAIVEGIEGERPGVRSAAVHRVGRLEIGEAAVVCGASAPHRAEAFEACRRLVDRIKEEVPIWKLEEAPDGQRWVGWANLTA